jgi:hypothetical protein
MPITIVEAKLAQSNRIPRTRQSTAVCANGHSVGHDAIAVHQQWDTGEIRTLL